MAKVKLGKNSPSHVSESYTLPDYTSKPGYEGTFYIA